MIKEAEALSPFKLGNHVENLESEQSDTGSWSRSQKIFEQKGPFKYLNRPIHAFVKKLLHHVASVESTSQKKKVKQLLQKVCIHYKANFNGDFIKFY
jgi:hypothetical protein